MSCVIDFYFFFESYSSWKIKILLTDKKKKTINVFYCMLVYVATHSSAGPRYRD